MDETIQNNQEQPQNPTQAAEPISVSALNPTATAAPTVGVDPRDAEIAELKHRLEVESAEQGRIRKANDELRKMQEENARLKAEIETFKQRRFGDNLTPEERAGIDEDQFAAIGKAVEGRINALTASQKEENDRLRQEIARRDASMAQSVVAQFNAEVDRLAPGLAAAVGEHGDEWKKWATDRRRAASVAQAFASNDAEMVATFLQEFAESKGIRANGDGLAARPNSSFSPRGGSHPVSTGGDTATYTVEQYSQAMRRASNDFSAGRITADEYRAIKKKFDTALKEGRIVRE